MYGLCFASMQIYPKFHLAQFGSLILIMPRRTQGLMYFKRSGD